MVNLKNAVGSVVLSVVAIANVAISSEIDVLQKQPQITVQASDYIAMQNTTVSAVSASLLAAAFDSFVLVGFYRS